MGVGVEGNYFDIPCCRLNRRWHVTRGTQHSAHITRACTLNINLSLKDQPVHTILSSQIFMITDAREQVAQTQGCQGDLKRRG